MERNILNVARENYDAGDVFAWCQGWRFVLCDFLTHEYGEQPDGFRPDASGPDEDAYEYERIAEEGAQPDELWYAFKILDRYREWLRLAGRDY